MNPAPDQAARRYVVTLGILGTIGTLVAMGMLWLIDPFGIYRPPVVSRINALKAVDVVKLLDRRFKPADIAREKPQCLILGTSRAERGIDMDDPLVGAGWYNASLNEGTPYEALRMLQHAQAITPLRHVVLLMNLKEYSDADANMRSDFPDPCLAVDARNRSQRFAAIATAEDALLGWTAVDWSWRTLVANHLTATGMPIDAIYHHGGLTTEAWKAYQPFYGHREMFRFIESHGVLPFYQGMSRDPARLFISPGWRSLTALLDFCREHAIAIDLVFAPEHARVLYLNRAAGLWPVFEAWKLAVVAAVRSAPPGLMTVWDCSAITPEIAEPLPSTDDHTESMRFWRDSIHYRPILGHQMLTAILAHQPGLGHQLTANDDLSDWLQGIRSGLDAWVAANPSEAAEVDQEARAAAIELNRAAQF